MGRIVPALHFNRDAVEFASPRLRDESNPGIKTLPPFLSFSENHYGRELFGGFSRSHINACYWLHKAISMSFPVIRRRSKVDLVDSCFSEDFMCCFVYMYIFISEWKGSVVDTWNLFIYLMDFITGKEGEREQTARWGIVSHNNLFSSTSLYYLQTEPVCNLYAQINLLSGKGKTDRKSRTATAQWKLPSLKP